MRVNITGVLSWKTDKLQKEAPKHQSSLLQPDYLLQEQFSLLRWADLLHFQFQSPKLENYSKNYLAI